MLMCKPGSGFSVTACWYDIGIHLSFLVFDTGQYCLYFLLKSMLLPYKIHVFDINKIPPSVGVFFFFLLRI
jgi:hypothetical protein